MSILYIIVFVFIACALGSIVTVWGADSALSANSSASPLEQIEQLYNQVKKEIKDLLKAGEPDGTLPAGFLTSPLEPVVFDSDFIVQKFSTGLEFPTTMYFVGDDILVLEKFTGKVIRIKDNGAHYNESVLDVPVDACWESGFLGISGISNHVFLYFTESESGFDKIECHDQPVKNKVYRYDWNGEKLINPILIKELPGNLEGHHRHNGGAMTKSQNNEIYFVIGDLSQSGTFQNIPNKIIYETSSIFKVVTESNNSVELYAMGIRNSFGLAVDPITGYLWDTENSPTNYDEINLVKPGFNSGWKRVMGPVDRDNPDIDGPQTIPPPFENFVYSDPEFSFYHAVGLTAIEFPDRGSFEKYSDWLFVGDYNNGRIYKFQLNSDRTEFVFSNPELSDLVLDDNDEIDEILFAKGFQTVTDIEFHDDAMYVVSISDGSIYKIYEPTQSELANKIVQDTILTLILVGTAIAVTLGITIGVIRRKRISS